MKIVQCSVVVIYYTVWFTYLGFYRAAEFCLCLSVCLSVRLSVCPSVKCVNCDKMKEKSVYIFRPYDRPFSLVY